VPVICTALCAVHQVIAGRLNAQWISLYSDNAQLPMNSPVYYIIVAMMFASGTLSFIFFMTWMTQGKKPYALSWSVGFLAAAAQWFFNLQSHWFETGEAHSLTVDAFALILTTLIIRGHCQRTNCKRLPKNLWPFTLIIYAGIVWTTLYDPHVGISTALVPATASLTLFISALMILRHREVTRAAEWAAAMSLVLFGLAQGVAAIMALMQGADGDAVYENIYIHSNYLMLPSGYMAMGMFVLFMLASDLSEQMKELAVRDQLTGVLNRHGLTERSEAAYLAFRKDRMPVSIIMIDIDRFKDINDEHGHSAGDAALVHFADLLKDDRETDDILARVGGEEFALVLPHSDLMSAMKIADELCTKVEKTPMRLNGVVVNMTASFGVAAVSKKDGRLADAIERADRALYRSKHAGRNQVDLESSQLMRALDGSLKPLND
jgi:diguanylate cyclase (GGDEF)-like protein